MTRAVKATFRCSCGSSARATSKPPGYAQDIVDSVRQHHLGDGHHEVDDTEFRRIRARQRREEAKALGC